MRKALPYIICILFVAFTCYWVIRAKDKKVNTFITLKKTDKNPYGTYVFHESLKTFFPKSKFQINYGEPGNNKVFGDNKPNQLYLIVLPYFDPSENEFDDIISFIERGNNVFISTFNINEDVMSFIKAETTPYNFINYPVGDAGPDTMQVSILSQASNLVDSFSYPGTFMKTSFTKTDSSISSAIGFGEKKDTNLIYLQKGNGRLYLHTSPLALSNYFLLYKNNIRYFEKIFSRFPDTTPLIIWDEYFNHPHTDKNGTWLRDIMADPYFRAGILTALLFLLIYTVLEMRRRQRIIPIIQKPVNDSLEFVKTIGLLYYEKADHLNLAQKMSSYFLENVRSRYKLFSKKLDDAFVRELSDKSGVNESLVSEIIGQIKLLSAEGVFTDTELITLQQNIESFYNRI